MAPLGLGAAEWARFSRDGRTLYLDAKHRDGRRGIWAIPTAGTGARLAVWFNDPARVIPDPNKFAVSRDRLYLALGEYESDIWVARLKW